MAALLLGFAAALVSVAWKTGVTIDEPPHLLSAHLYWQGEDNLVPGDMPPLIKMTGGWVPHLFGLPVPYDDAGLWKSRSEWDIAVRMMDRLRAPLLQRVFFFSRLPLLIFPLLTCFTLWWWAHQLYSPKTALWAAAFFCLLPGVLGHGALFKNDLAASFGFLLFWYRAWVYWRGPSVRNAAWLSGGLLIAILAKMSMLILLPAAVAVLLSRQCVEGSLRWKKFALAVGAGFLILWCGAAVAWQFRISTVREVELNAWQSDARIPGWIPEVARVAGGVVPTPQRLREGAISLVQSNASATSVYLLGNVYPEGHPLYFLVALAAKAPLPLLALLSLAGILWAVAAWRRTLAWSDLFWSFPPLLYLVLASLSSLQLGYRLILPSVVFFVLWTAFAIERFPWRRAVPAVAAAALIWMAGRAVAQYPHYISSFNRLAGGSNQGLRYLSDSNLDWGQDLPSLAEYLERSRISKLRLAYFGMDNPYAYVSDQQVESIAPPWADHFARGLVFEPEPGYYAISATLLTGQLFAPKYRDYFRKFRESEPIAKAGYSIFVYKVPSAAGVGSNSISRSE